MDGTRVVLGEEASVRIITGSICGTIAHLSLMQNGLQQAWREIANLLSTFGSLETEEGHLLIALTMNNAFAVNLNCGAPKGRVAVATYSVGQFQSSVSLVLPACFKRCFLRVLEGGFITGAAVIGCSRDVMHPSTYSLPSFGQIGASLATQPLATFFECSSLIVVIVPVQLTAGSNPLFTSDILWSSQLL